MDYNLDIIISESDLPKIPIKEKIIVWCGNNYSHSPRKFETYNGIIFTELTHGPIYDYIMSGLVIDNSIILTCNNLSNFITAINSTVQNSEYKNIISVLNKISKLNRFSFYLWEDDAELDVEYKINSCCNIEAVIKELFILKGYRNLKIYSQN